MRCYACKKYKFLLSKGLPIGSLLLFVCGATPVKSIFFLSKGPPIGSSFLFVRGATRVKSMMVRDINQEPLPDLYTLVH
jgi:hypothetical protein